MRCNVEVEHLPSVVRENEEDVENAEGNCRNREEIDRDKLFGVVFQKCAPCLGGQFGMSGHVFSDSCLRNVDSNLSCSSELCEYQETGIFAATEWWEISGNGRLNRIPHPLILVQWEEANHCE
jgi:hypothetical protein